MGINRKEGRKLINQKASIMYKGSALRILSYMVDISFEVSDKVGFNAARTRTVKVANLLRIAGIKDSALRNIIRRFTKDGIGVFVREDEKITFCLNLEPLKRLADPAETPEELKAKKAADRGAKAREVYAEEKRLEELELVETIRKQHAEEQREATLRTGTNRERRKVMATWRAKGYQLKRPKFKQPKRKGKR